MPPNAEPVAYRSHLVLRHAVPTDEIRGEAARHLRERFAIDIEDVAPRVFYRLTDNWLELSVRFLVEAHGVREVKDRMSRELLQGLEEAGIEVASSTYDLVGIPPVRVRLEQSPPEIRREAPAASSPAPEAGARGAGRKSPGRS